MSGFNDIFGGSSVNPANLSFATYDLADSLTLEWPGDGLVTENAVVDIISLRPTTAGRSVTMPDATKGSVGTAVLMYNRGSELVSIVDATSETITAIAAGEAFYLILTDVSTVAGSWDLMEFGAVTSAAQASQLASSSIAALGSVLVQSWPVSIRSTDYTTGVADRGNALVWIGGSGQITLGAAGSVGAGWFTAIRNAGEGTLTLTLESNNDALDGVEGAAGATSLEPGESAIVVCTGNEFYLICRTTDTTSSFSYLEIDVSGTGDYTLSAAELGYSAYRLNGTLTGNRNVIVPATVAQYLVNNKTTGAFTLTVKTAAGTGIAVATNEAKLLYADGTNVVDGATSGISTPISVANGGTGATTGDNALANLGGSSTGIAVFKAASPAAARSSLGVGGAGDQVFTAITQGAARAALGATTIGDALIIAATQAAALSAIGAAGTAQANVWSVGTQEFQHALLVLLKSTVNNSLGGRMIFDAPTTTTLSNDVIVDVSGEDFRIFEAGGTGRGAFLPIDSQSAGAAAEIWTSETFPKATTSLSDFNEAVDDRVASLLIGFGVEVAYDDGGPELVLTRRSSQLDIDIATGVETILSVINISQFYDRLDVYLTQISTGTNTTISFGYSTNNGLSYTDIPMGNVVAANSVGGRITIERYSSANGQQKHITILWEEGGVVKVTRHTGTGINGVRIILAGSTFDSGGALTVVAS